MNRCVIVSAAPIADYEKVKSFLKKDDYFIFCDSGLNHCKMLGVSPNLIVGDFDSFDKTKLYKKPFCDMDIEIKFLPCEKDDTDTFYAIKEGLKRGYENFLLVGMIGNRFDHSLCNISALNYLHSHKAKAKLIDDYSVMEIIGKDEEIKIKDKYSYFSLMNCFGDVSGVTIENAKYPLTNEKIKADYSYAISNEVIKGKEAVVSIKNGKLLVIKIF